MALSSEHSGFFNAQQTSGGEYDRTYNAEDFSNVFRQFLGNGIMVTDEEAENNTVFDKTTCHGLKPSISGTSNVQVAPGFAFINGYWYHNDSIASKAIQSSWESRLLVLQFATATRQITLEFIPHSDSLTQTEYIYQIPIASVQRSGSVFTVTDAREDFITASLKAIQNLVDNTVDKFYPVGSVYISVNDTNPSTLFGGTWERFAAGRTLVGVDTGQTEFNTVKKTGGAKTVALTVNQIPSHSHKVTIEDCVYYVGEGATGSGAHDMSEPSTDWVTKTANTGGGQAHNNLQPYITVYFWLRTA